MSKPDNTTGSSSPEGGPSCVIRWPDGSVTRGESATEVLATLAYEQFDPEAKVNIKKALAQRVSNVADAVIDWQAEDDEFLDSLAATGIVKVERS